MNLGFAGLSLNLLEFQVCEKRSLFFHLTNALIYLKAKNYEHYPPAASETHR